MRPNTRDTSINSTVVQAQSIVNPRVDFGVHAPLERAVPATPCRSDPGTIVRRCFMHGWLGSFPLNLSTSSSFYAAGDLPFHGPSGQGFEDEIDTCRSGRSASPTWSSCESRTAARNHCGGGAGYCAACGSVPASCGSEKTPLAHTAESSRLKDECTAH